MIALVPMGARRPPLVSSLGPLSRALAPLIRLIETFIVARRRRQQATRRLAPQPEPRAGAPIKREEDLESQTIMATTTTTCNAREGEKRPWREFLKCHNWLRRRRPSSGQLPSLDSGRAGVQTSG